MDKGFQMEGVLWYLESIDETMKEHVAVMKRVATAIEHLGKK